MGLLFIMIIIMIIMYVEHLYFVLNYEEEYDYGTIYTLYKLFKNNISKIQCINEYITSKQVVDNRYKYLFSITTIFTTTPKEIYMLLDPISYYIYTIWFIYARIKYREKRTKQTKHKKSYWKNTLKKTDIE